MLPLVARGILPSIFRNSPSRRKQLNLLHFG